MIGSGPGISLRGNSSRAFPILLCVLLALSTGVILIEARSPDSYEVFAYPKEYPDDGPRTIEVDPALSGGEASPFGWHDTDGLPGAEYTVTRGNNVYAYTDVNGDNVPDPGSSPDGGPTLDFLFPLDLGDDPVDYQPASVTNAFYWSNLIHDVLYRYGFDESAGNFQENNYGRGGLSGDPFLVEVQEGAFTNGITVTIPPDGQSPRMQLGIFTLTNPRRDSALSSFVNIYGYARAVSVRLVGGPENVDCLVAEESGGMSVGWSDWIALVLTADPSEMAATSRGVGTYIFGQPPTGPGIRDAPYSTDFGINPLTYDSIKTLASPFGTGNVWATMLWQVYWELVEVHGFNPDIYGDWTTGGNNLALQLILDGMKIVACNPGFVDGRDAILQADEDLTGGANRCEIWRGFADRGLGFSADQGSPSSTSDGIEAFDLPADCLSTSVDGGDGEAEGPTSLLVLEDPNTPNPFAMRTSLRFTLQKAARIRLSVHDLQGRQVAVLIDAMRAPGDHTAAWNGRRDNGEPAGSGVYFVRLRSEDESVSRKVVLTQ
jgi:hypothetical protein